ncbi:MAG: HNH endonuclease family protein [Cyanobacteria bacterium P01_D01_bin.50]
MICNQHVTPLKKIYLEESRAIRENPGSYNTLSLRQKLQKLINDKASKLVFRNALGTLEYKLSGGSNKPLKYFLMTIEYYYQWYQSGAKGTPSCIDKSRIYDFAGTSIEHIYPQKADIKDENLEPLINTLGNLTILDPAQNTIASNDAFEAKKTLFQQSSVELTRNIGKKQAWTEQEVENHKNMLIDIALKVFYP